MVLRPCMALHACWSPHACTSPAGAVTDALNCKRAHHCVWVWHLRLDVCKAQLPELACCASAPAAWVQLQPVTKCARVWQPQSYLVPHACYPIRLHGWSSSSASKSAPYGLDRMLSPCVHSYTRHASRPPCHPCRPHAAARGSGQPVDRII
jgi:hypothetical protein